MANTSNAAVITIDPVDKAIHYYATNGNRIIHEVRSYRSALFDKEFYETFTTVLSEFGRKFSPTNAADTTIVLPDNSVFTDVLNFPVIKKTALKSTINVMIAGSYKNKDELKINTSPAVLTKLSSSYLLVGVRNDIISGLKNACTNARFLAKNITFAANTTVNALSTMNSKLKAATYMLMDIKEKQTRFVYVFKGRAAAFYTMNMGFETLRSNKVVSEDLVLEHPVAELAVLNARERAKAKELTLMGNTDAVQQAEGSEEEGAFSGTDAADASHAVHAAKILPKKVARKLPKFMQREIPDTPEGVAFENFRIFMKWALCFIEGNSRLTALGAPSSVVVNMPQEFDFLYAMANAEEAENKIKFVPSGVEKKKDDITRNLEMYGGLFAHRMNTDNNF